MSGQFNKEEIETEQDQNVKKKNGSVGKLMPYGK